MKKISAMLLVILIMLCLTVFAACPEKESEVPEEKEKINTLVGKWKEPPAKGTDREWYEAEITEDTILLFFCDWNGNKDIFWSGSYKDPSEPCKTYTFNSKMLADGTDINGEPIYWDRDFIYEDGILWTEYISGEATAPWVGTKIRLQKVVESETN